MDGQIQTGAGRAGRAGSISSRSASGSRRSGRYLWLEVGEASGVGVQRQAGGYHGAVEYIVSRTA